MFVQQLVKFGGSTNTVKNIVLWVTQDLWQDHNFF